jgi:hypothetical protein
MKLNETTRSFFESMPILENDQDAEDYESNPQNKFGSKSCLRLDRDLMVC